MQPNTLAERTNARCAECPLARNRGSATSRSRQRRTLLLRGRRDGGVRIDRAVELDEYEQRPARDPGRDARCSFDKRASSPAGSSRLLGTSFDRLRARCPGSRFAQAKRKPAPRRPGRPVLVQGGRVGPRRCRARSGREGASARFPRPVRRRGWWEWDRRSLIQVVRNCRALWRMRRGLAGAADSPVFRVRGDRITECQGRWKMHPVAPVENAPPVVPVE
jgi:hypothetical protein